MLMSFHTDYDKLLNNYKTIWTKIEDIKNIELNALSVYDVGMKKVKICVYRYKFYASFCGLNLSKDGLECTSFTIFLLILCWFMKTNISTSMLRQLFW